jgi:hypothetical protein
MTHASSWLAPALPSLLPCAAVPAALVCGTAAASNAAALGFTAWTHLCLWPCFQCCFWQTELQ